MEMPKIALIFCKSSSFRGFEPAPCIRGYDLGRMISYLKNGSCNLIIIPLFQNFANNASAIREQLGKHLQVQDQEFLERIKFSTERIDEALIFGYIEQDSSCIIFDLLSKKNLDQLQERNMIFSDDYPLEILPMIFG